MSSGIALVRFGDGTVKVGNYHGTSDLLVPRPFDTAMEATDAYFEGRDGWSDPEGDVEDVVVYVDYGKSFWFEAKATRTSVLPELRPARRELRGPDGPAWSRPRARRGPRRRAGLGDGIVWSPTDVGLELKGRSRPSEVVARVLR